jgi:hypothetical protein
LTLAGGHGLQSPETGNPRLIRAAPRLLGVAAGVQPQVDKLFLPLPSIPPSQFRPPANGSMGRKESHPVSSS